MGDLITMDDLTNEEIIILLDNAKKMLPAAKGDVHLPLLQGKVLANMFFENSNDLSAFDHLMFFHQSLMRNNICSMLRTEHANLTLNLFMT